MNIKGKLQNENGQLIVIIVLIITVILAVGLSVIQKSLGDISTATKVEQSHRAFSAAEAGVEKTLQGGDPNCGDPTKKCVIFENDSDASVADTGFLPGIPSPGVRQDPIQYNSLFRDSIAQVWLADFSSSSHPLPERYTETKLDVYWGDPMATDKAALELTLIYHDGSEYTWKKWFLDQPVIRDNPNGFCQVSTCGGSNQAGSVNYQCKFTLGDSSTCTNQASIIVTSNINNNSSLKPNAQTKLTAIRARLLYNDNSQPLAFWANPGTCGALNCTLPGQKREIYSTGTSGDTQRKVKVSQFKDVVPFYFDYAIFSAGDISK